MTDSSYTNRRLLASTGSMNIEIRAAVSQDAESLASLASRSKAHWGYSQEFMDACREELLVQPSDIENPDFSYVVGEVDDAIVGFYALERLTALEVELRALFVEPTLIGSGIGRALMENAKSRARQLGAESIVIQGDPNAADFYRATGATRKGSRESGSIPGRFLPVFELQLVGARHT